MSDNFKFEPHELAGEALRHVYRSRDNALAVTAFSGVILAGVLVMSLGVLVGAGWYVALLLANLWHWRIGDPERLDVGVALLLERRQHIAAAVLAGFGWGMAAIAMPWLSHTNQSLVLVMLMVAATTALPRLAVFLPIFFGYVLGIVLPLLLVMLTLDQDAQQMERLVLLMTVAALWLSAREVRAVLNGVLLKQISYERASWEDRLTGLGNRRRFDDVLDSAWRQAARLRVPLSLIILDVDHFKNFNDNYGHPQGDECLRRVAGALAGCVKRAGDSVARYGGEEFAVVLFHTSMMDARAMGERLRKAVIELGIEHGFSSAATTVTISVGGATMVPGANSKAADLLGYADAALYRAKQNGRNRVEWNVGPQL